MADPIDGTWISVVGFDTLALTVDASLPGSVSGTLSLDGELLNVIGFTDIHATEDSLNLQSLSIATSVNSAGYVSTLTGNLNAIDGRIHFFELTSRGTSTDDIWTQTMLVNKIFIKQ
ncbi:MAG: hypothetical protein HRU28_16405 [Rhizobiales bacterium]|nr:hypothetical protein [Hyphomicrobiales bacterium]